MPMHDKGAYNPEKKDYHQILILVKIAFHAGVLSMCVIPTLDGRHS